MKKSVNIVLLVAGMLVFFAGAALQNSILMGLGTICFLLAIAIDHRRARRNHEMRRTAIAQRINDLTSHQWPDGKVLAVASNNMFMLVVGVVIALGSFATAYSGISSAPRSWGMAAISLLVFLITSVTIPRSIASIGKPALVLRKSGISSPLFGFIPWTDITGISLQTYSFRGQVTYTLVFRLNLSSGKKYDLHWTESILWALGLGVMRRRVVAIPLKENDGDDYPETITATAKHLWHQETGQSHDWNPLFSEEYNQAAKRLSDLVAEKRALQPAAASFPFQVPSPAEQRQAIDDVKTMSGERTRKLHQMNWWITIAVLGSLVSLAWPLIKAYFR